jgi:leucyl/phenylalanyl-tRNA--protein transferase
MKAGGFRLLYTKFPTPHLALFGAIAVDRKAYPAMLEAAIAATADFHFLGGGTSDFILQSVSQTS